MFEPESSVLDFEKLKREIVDIIANAEMTITTRKSHTDSGIYLLYVDHFSDDRIIPFYIGQTSNFQKRLSAHIRDVARLFKIPYADYHNKFFWGSVGHRLPFEGKYRPCKILKYLVDHDVSMDKIKMIVLEKCPTEQLDEREQYYLSKYLPAFFGFNQIATITEQFRYCDNHALKHSIIQRDFECFDLYMEYGYSAFNYLHAFASYGDNQMNELVNSLISNQEWPAPSALLSATSDAFMNYRKAYESSYSIIAKKFSGQVHSIFEQCKFRSASREREVLSAFTNHIRTNIISDINDNLDYLDYYFSRNRMGRTCAELLFALYMEHNSEIEQITTPVRITFAQYLNARENAISQSRFSLIFPSKPYIPLE